MSTLEATSNAAPRLARSRAVSFAVYVLLAVVLPNLGFVALHYAARSLPVEPIRHRIMLAFAEGDMQADPRTFRFLDSVRGVEPWGDANTLRMAIYRGSSRWRDALAPRLLQPADGVERHPAAELHGAVFGNIAFDPNGGYYHRYWHGNVAIASFLMSAFPLRQVRLILMNASYFLFLLIPLAACAVSRRAGLLLGVICGFGVWFSSLPYHGQSITYAPAFLWSQMVALLIVLFCGAIGSIRRVVPLGIVLGAVAAFLEPASGAFLLTGTLLFLPLYFSLREKLPGREGFRAAAAALAAFLAGTCCSLLFKQTMAAVFFGWGDTFGVFLKELGWRMGMTGEKIGILHMAHVLWENSIYLTFGSVPLARILFVTSGAALSVGSMLAAIDLARGGGRERVFDYLAVGAAMALPLAWYALLPSHTVIHAWIVVRLLYIPLALCWVLLWLSSRALFRRAR